MESSFWLRRASIGSQVMVAIDANRYAALCAARTTFIDAGAFEQRYEILLGNHLALEQFCTEWSLRREVEMDHRYETGGTGVRVHFFVRAPDGRVASVF